MKNRIWTLVTVLCLLVPVVLLAVGMTVTACPDLACGDTTLTPGLTYYVLRYRDGSVCDVGDEWRHRHPENFSGSENPLSLLYELRDFGDRTPDDVEIILHTGTEDVACTPADLGALPVSMAEVEYAFLYLVWQMPLGTNANAVYYFE